MNDTGSIERSWIDGAGTIDNVGIHSIHRRRHRMRRRIHHVQLVSSVGRTPRLTEGCRTCVRKKRPLQAARWDVFASLFFFSMMMQRGIGESHGWPGAICRMQLSRRRYRIRGGGVEGVGKTTTTVWMRVGDSGWWRARIDLVPRFVATPSVRELP